MNMIAMVPVHFAGLETAKDLWARGAEVHLLCRNQNDCDDHDDIDIDDN